MLGEDYWEEDQQQTSYNPAVAAAGRPVLRRLAGETPSARKEFRRQEAARLGGMVGYREKPMWSAGLRRQEASPFLSGQVTRGVVVRHVERQDLLWVVPPPTEQTEQFLKQVVKGGSPLVSANSPTPGVRPDSPLQVCGGGRGGQHGGRQVQGGRPCVSS